MHTTIILAHPWHGSYNKSILDETIHRLELKEKAYQVIDLNKEQFDPVLREADLAGFSKGVSKDPLVLKYQEMLTTTDELIFIFPIWWYDTPAILKGFFDKVMLKNFAYVETPTGLKGLLKHIQKTLVITTSEVPTWYLNVLAGNPIQGTFIKRTLGGIGLTHVKWLNNGRTASGSPASREQFLKHISKLV